MRDHPWDLGRVFGGPAGADQSERPAPRCKRCGSTDVRWRQQGGRWVLFSLAPGVEHTCDSTDDFDDLPDDLGPLTMSEKALLVVIWTASIALVSGFAGWLIATVSVGAP